MGTITSLFQKVFSSKKGDQYPTRDYKLESICFSTQKTSNSQMPTKIHLVIVYDYELAKDLIKRSAKQYFQMLDSLISTHAQFLKIMEWNLPAREYVSPYIEITYNNKSLKPACMIIFSNVGGKKSKSGRYVISEQTKHVHVYVKQKNLQLDETNMSVIKGLKDYKKKFGNNVQINNQSIDYDNYENSVNAMNNPSMICDMSMSAPITDENYNVGNNVLDDPCFGEQALSQQYEDAEMNTQRLLTR